MGLQRIPTIGSRINNIPYHLLPYSPRIIRTLLKPNYQTLCTLTQTPDNAPTHSSPSLSSSSPRPIAYSQLGYRWRPMCLYFTQGKCAKFDDPVHLEKFNHDCSRDLPVKEADLEKKRPQDFDFFLVLDLEGKVEILEFPVLLMDGETMRVVDLFHRFVRPSAMTEQRVNEYIGNKYGKFGVDEVWHDTAIPFNEVLQQFEAWLIEHHLWKSEHNGTLHRAAFVTCGNWDVKTQIPHQCKVSKIKLPSYFTEWINLKDVFQNFYKPKKQARGMRTMMDQLKLPMLGSHHLGLDDTKNIARVLQRMLADGAVIPITARRNLGSGGDEKLVDQKLMSKIGGILEKNVNRPTQLLVNQSFSSEWLAMYMTKVGRGKWGEIAAICWGLWKHRNAVLWESKRSNPMNIVWHSLHSLKAWISVNARKVIGGSNMSQESKWKKPQTGWISCTVDAGVFSDSGGCAMVRRDEFGSFIGGAVLNFPHLKDPAILEVLAIREALSWIKARKVQNVLVESDCMEAVNAINGASFTDSYYGLLIMDCQSLLSTLFNVKVVFIGRTANSSAHTLVKAFGYKPGRHV